MCGCICVCVLPASEAIFGGRVVRGNVTKMALLTCSGLYSNSASARAVLRRNRERGLQELNRYDINIT